jgi:sulfotransferase family protein
MSEIELSLSALIAAAQRRCGLNDFGSEDFETPLQVLLTSLNEEANLNMLGRFLQFERLTELLVNRLRLQQFIARHPEILEEQVRAPLVIAGLPRTGTTMLQRIISVEPNLLSTRWYEMRFPVPALDWDFAPERDERIGKAQAEVAALIAANPDLLSMHPLDAMAADEDLLLMENTFLSVMAGSQAHVPSYNYFFETTDTTPVYRYHKKLLQFMQWQRRRGGDAVDNKRWVLKSPAHMHEIAALFAVYPDVKIVLSHRDPLACIPSISSLYFAVWKVYSDNVDPRACGRYCKNFYALALRRTREAQQKHPQQFLDLDYRQLIKEPDAAIARLFDFIGIPLLPQTAAALQQWRQQNRRSQRAAHQYDLAEFGLDEAGVRAAFADYYPRHNFQEI